jgi:NitT/TauT family transport system permease protein
MRQTRTSRIQTIAYPLGFFALLMVTWHFAVKIFAVPRYVMPAPADVLDRFLDERSEIWRDVIVTLIETLSGLTLAIAAGLVFGTVISHSRVAFLTIYPYLVALSTVPIIAIAPLLIVWLGYGLAPKIAVSALIAFLPIVINTIRGLGSTDYRALMLMDSIAAGKMPVFWKVRFPTAMPYIFAAFKIAVPAATVGAVVGEFLGSDEGMGAVIILATSRLQMDLLFVAIFLLGATGVTLFLIVSLSERVLLRWYDGTTTL